MQPFDPWMYRDPTMAEGYGRDDTTTGTRSGADLVGYSVEATDGSIGSIDETSNEVGASYLVVDTGPWIFGRKVMLPAGTVQRIDHQDRKVYVDRTKDQIKDSPEYDMDTFGKPDYRDRVGSYYEQSYRSTPPLM
jgi:hypothetical protein